VVTVPSPAVADDTDIRSLSLTTADGVELEAEVRLPSDGDAGGDAVRGAVVLAHPHPMQGGSMASLVTSELFRLLPQRGLAALRFNFRGVGRSGGEHGHGRAEGADVTAALDAMQELWPHRPLVLSGWSFGADVSLSLTDERIDGWAAIAPPLRVLPVEELTAAAGTDPRPKLLIVPEHDEIRQPDSAREATAGWVNTTVEVVPGADHFLVGRTEKAARLVAAFAASLA
jgi:alpha/beta superfamily hydrolase